ncbi:MAG TPA: primosomal protein [Balneola sp.]|nr:primosomal protein [Balneola sp.]
MNKYVLKEFMNLDYSDDLLNEEERAGNRDGTHLILAGKIQMCNEQNGNGRVYPQGVLEREIKNYGKLVKERRSLGELDHPDESVINLKNASHLITDVWWEGNSVMGKLKILDTPAGQIAKQLVGGGVQLGISSRGLGSTHQQGSVTMVGDDFQLLCFDLVSEPSTTGAFLVAENKIKTHLTKADRINRALNDILGS